MHRLNVPTACALALAALVGGGCQDQPTAPTHPEAPVAAPPAPAPPPALVPYVDPGFPPAPAGAAVYGRISPSSLPGNQRYLLLDGGRFTLQYLRPNGALYEAAGSYSRTAAGAHFVFDANGGRWQADVTIDGDLLIARYNLEATLDDFEDGTYERQPPGR